VWGALSDPTRRRFWICCATVRECDNSRELMKIKLTSVYIDDQEKALRFSAEVLGFVKFESFDQ
jgi:hypothetical protein